MSDKIALTKEEVVKEMAQEGLSFLTNGENALCGPHFLPILPDGLEDCLGSKTRELIKGLRAKDWTVKTHFAFDGQGELDPRRIAIYSGCTSSKEE